MAQDMMNGFDAGQAFGAGVQADSEKYITQSYSDPATGEEKILLIDSASGLPLKVMNAPRRNPPAGGGTAAQLPVAPAMPAPGQMPAPPMPPSLPSLPQAGLPPPAGGLPPGPLPPVQIGGM